MYEQARAIFAKIKHLMEAAGGRMDDIVKVVIYVTDIKRREECGKLAGRCSAATSRIHPDRDQALATPDLLVEIDAIGI